MTDRPLRFGHHLTYGAFKVVLFLGSILPLSVLRWLGRVLARCVKPFVARERRREDQQLALAFPDMKAEARRDLRNRSEIHLGNLLGEVAWLMHADPRAVETMCDITGEEHLFRALEAGSGAVLITGHIGNWELLNARLGLSGIPMSIAVRNVYDSRIDTIANNLRARFGTKVIHRGYDAARQLFSALRSNRVNGLLIDQDIRDIAGTFVPFFGKPAWTPSGAAAIALKTGSPMIPAFDHRRSDGTHLVEVHPPLTVPAEGSTEDRVRQLTADATAAIERQIRAHPEQWVWMHRRWKTKPNTKG